MYELSPVTERIQRIRQRYRSTKPKVDTHRYRLMTDFYQNNPQLTGILKRAKALRNLFENMPTPVFEDELISGFQGATYRSCALYPEQTFDWFMNELRAGTIPTRGVDPYDIDEEDAKYLDETGDWWVKNGFGPMFDEYIPRTYRDKIGNNGCLGFHPSHNPAGPVGHFAANFWKAVDPGFLAIQREAEEKMAQIEEDGFQDNDAYKYNFYRAVSIVCEGIIIWADHYGDECDRQAAECTDSKRKAELEEMADSFHWIYKNPCRNFHDAVQAVYLYQLAMCMDAQQHGISFGRVDQYVGKYAEADIAAGRKTREECQEIMDSFYLKVAECNKIWSEMATKSGPGYTSGMLMTLGGVDKEGNDATNAATYMMLESASRLLLHSPPQAMRVHDGTPDDLWELALLASRRAGGVPSYEYDGVIIPALMKRGVALEDARNYCLIGCVELQVTGAEWAQPGGTGAASYYNIVTAFLQALNNGVDPFRRPGAPEPVQTGPATGYLYEMESMDEVLAAVKTQFDYYGKWQCALINMWETLMVTQCPLPMVSATFDGCMESGKDVMWGGAKYNSCGNSCVGPGNVADSLNIIDQLCFREKYCTTRELYDAIMNNWEGYEELRQYIVGKAGHYGNANDEYDKYLSFVFDAYADCITKNRSTRGCHFAPGCYPVTLNVMFGWGTAATPDGRKAGEPLCDGISPLQGQDKNGPVSTINSLLKFDQTKYSNGTLCNMKFHPTVLQGEDGFKKLRAVMESYFQGGGMELQLNIVSSETLRDAQAHPENYQDLVVRVAGFSAYFVEVFKESQDDLIKRTELNL